MEREHQLFSSERLVSYSDAIFSIAITLLILEIKIHNSSIAEEANLLVLLADNWPKFLSFLISFLIISVIWFNHHTMFHYIKQVDHTLMFINTALMFNVVVIPFCASLLGEFAAQGTRNSVYAALIYGGWITIGGIPFNLIWTYTLRHTEVLHVGYQMEDLQKIKKHFMRGPFLYLICTLLALFNVWFSILGFSVLILIYFLPAAWWAITRTRKTNRGK